MPYISSDIRVTIFDPITPFQKIVSEKPGIDTWHDYVIITSKIRKRLANIEDTGTRDLRLSGGMYVEAPMVVVGLQIGTIVIPEVEALVVDKGDYDILLGSDIFSLIFKAGRAESSDDEKDVSVSSEAQEDPEAFSLELYPLDYPFPAKNLENIIRNQRIIYNILVIALEKINVSDLTEAQIDEIVNNDTGIPDDLLFKVNSITNGSIRISYKSGSLDILKHLASFFEKGASAKLSQEVAEAENAEISKETRDVIALEVVEEKAKLRPENIRATYEAYQEECRAHLNFWDELIEQLTDPDLVDELKKLKNQAILEIAEQQMVPIVRNIPGAYFSIDGGQLALPPPRD